MVHLKNLPKTLECYSTAACDASEYLDRLNNDDDDDDEDDDDGIDIDSIDYNNNECYDFFKGWPFDSFDCFLFSIKPTDDQTSVPN